MSIKRYRLIPKEGACPEGWVGISVKLADEEGIARLLIRVAGEKKKVVTLTVSLRGPYDGKLRTIVKIPKGVIGVSLDAKGVEDAFLEPLTRERIGQILGGAKLRRWLRRPRESAGFLGEAFGLLSKRRFRELKASFKEELFYGEIDVRTPYAIWVENYASVSADGRKSMEEAIKSFTIKPKISILMPVYNTDERWLRRAIGSVRAQIYPHWELCVADDCSSLPHVRKVLAECEASDFRIRIVYRKSNGHIAVASNSALELANGEFLALLDHDDEMSPDALFHIARIINKRPDLDLIYSDEDKIDAHGRLFDPHFKPDWNIDLFYSLNLITHLCVLRTELVKKLGGFRAGFEGSQDYDLFLRVIEKIGMGTERIAHVPRVLYHWRTIPGSTAVGPEGKSYAVTTARKALADHFKRTGVKADVVEGVEAFHRVIYRLPNKLPSVSAIICTRDRVELLKGVMEGLLDKTDYPRLEIVVVNNDSRDAETLKYFKKLGEDPRVRVLDYRGSFNFSAMNNMAVRECKGEVIAFLNNDLEVIEPGWLTEMVRFAVQPGIGAVGARLLFPNDRIQHAGIVLGMGGVAGHPHKGFGKDEMGYVGRARVIQGFSGVTAACMLMRKKVFEESGGFDEKNLPVAFNDVDLCLRIREMGYRIVWTPFAELYHLESASRGSDETPERIDKFLRENKFMEEKWGATLLEDPFYSPNLTLNEGDFNLALPPRNLTK
jgi:O-antigen biosynthesis protein